MAERELPTAALVTIQMEEMAEMVEPTVRQVAAEVVLVFLLVLEGLRQ
jgi:hypothetical protein